jgi:hypothetical protein
MHVVAVWSWYLLSQRVDLTPRDGLLGRYCSQKRHIRQRRQTHSPTVWATTTALHGLSEWDNHDDERGWDAIKNARDSEIVMCVANWLAAEMGHPRLGQTTSSIQNVDTPTEERNKLVKHTHLSNTSQGSVVSESADTNSTGGSEQARPKGDIGNFDPIAVPARQTQMHGKSRHLPESAYKWGTLSSKQYNNETVKVLQDGNLLHVNSFSEPMAHQSAKGNSSLDSKSRPTKANSPLYQPIAPTMIYGPTAAFVPTQEFVDQIQEAFDLYKINPSLKLGGPIDLDALQSQTRLLCALLEERLDHHVNKSTMGQSQKESCIWEFTRLNMGRMAAAMIVMGHVAQLELNKGMNNSNVCLLSSRKHFLPLKFGTIPLNAFQGCYLMHSETFGFIRSGKVANRPFKHRLAEHQHKAMKSMQRSLDHRSVYQAFPSRLNGNTRIQLGYFEDLEFFAGLSFPVQDPHKSLYISNGEGIFLWEKSVLDHLKQKRQGQQRSLRQKQTDVVAFFCEFAYRLALSSASNVDRYSTGFEYWL